MVAVFLKNPWFARVILVIVLTLSLWTAMKLWSGLQEKNVDTIQMFLNASNSARKGSDNNGVLSSDGKIRHCITSNVVGYVNRMKYAKKTLIEKYSADKNGEESNKRRSSFKRVFDERVWVGGKGRNLDPSYNGLQASGSGSILRAAQEVMGALHVIIDHIKLQRRLSRVRFLDVPCGDMAWMSRFLDSRPDVDYVGFDIVPDLINNHRKLYTSKHPHWQFHLVDIVSEGINTSFTNFDLVLSRHMLQHLTTPDVMRVLGHVSELALRQSTPTYFLTTTWSLHGGNGELNTNGNDRFRPLNLEIPPFSLEPPLCLLNDGRPPDLLCCYLGLWRLPLIQVDCNGTKANHVRNTFGFGGSMYSCVDWSLKE